MRAGGALARTYPGAKTGVGFAVGAANTFPSGAAFASDDEHVRSLARRRRPGYVARARRARRAGHGARRREPPWLHVCVEGPRTVRRPWTSDKPADHGARRARRRPAALSWRTHAPASPSEASAASSTSPREHSQAWAIAATSAPVPRVTRTASSSPRSPRCASGTFRVLRFGAGGGLLSASRVVAGEGSGA